MRSKIWGGFLLAAIIAIAMPVFVNATTVDKNSTTIFDNPDSPKVLIVLRDVTGVKNYVQASFGYELVEDENNPAPVNNLPSGPLVLHIGNTPSDETHKVTGSMSITMANVEFSELGDYKFILREISSSDADNYPVDTEHEYYIYVSVCCKIIILSYNIYNQASASTQTVRSQSHHCSNTPPGESSSDHTRQEMTDQSEYTHLGYSFVTGYGPLSDP